MSYKGLLKHVVLNEVLVEKSFDREFSAATCSTKRERVRIGYVFGTTGIVEIIVL